MKLLSNERSASSSILIILGLFLINYLFIGGIVQLLIMFASGIGLSDLIESGGNIAKLPNAWLTMIVSQGVASLIAFVGTAWMYWQIIEKQDWNLLNSRPFPSIQIIGLVIVIQLAFMGFNGWLQDINQKMVLPEFLSGLEALMKSMEESLAEATKMLTSFSSFWQFLLAFLVIAVIAGIGEELLFRGLVLRKLFIGTNNIHLAVWGSAIIFSAIHFQFYGFLPRMMLGVMFGYFYYWTGNLWVPIVAHIFNNGLAVTVMYLNNLKVIDVDVETMDDVPTLAIISSLVVSVGLMFFMEKYVGRVSKSTENQD